MEPNAEARPSPRSSETRIAPEPSRVTNLRPEVPPRVTVNPERVKASRQTQVRGVQILPSRGDQAGGRSTYRLSVGLDTAPNPSILTRRTGTVAAFEFEVEEKELQPLARLTGRTVMVHYLLWNSDIEADDLHRENLDLREEIQTLRRKLKMVQDQLQYTVESQVRDQRF